jgi:hypothetical protein
MNSVLSTSQYVKGHLEVVMCQLAWWHWYPLSQSCEHRMSSTSRMKLVRSAARPRRRVRDHYEFSYILVVVSISLCILISNIHYGSHNQSCRLLINEWLFYCLISQAKLHVQRLKIRPKKLRTEEQYLQCLRAIRTYVV